MENIATEVIRILTASGLRKELVDLVKEKVDLLTEQIARLEMENKSLRSRNHVSEEEPALDTAAGNLSDATVKVLRLLFHQRLTASQIAQSLNLPKGITDYHLGVLATRKLVRLPAFRTVGAEPAYWLTQKGRAYIVEHELVASQNPSAE